MGDHRPMLQVGRYAMTSDISLSISHPIVFNMAAILWGATLLQVLSFWWQLVLTSCLTLILWYLTTRQHEKLVSPWTATPRGHLDMLPSSFLILRL